MTRVRLISHTRINPALTPRSVEGISDLNRLWQAVGTPAEAIIEYAGRVCYRSTHRMGEAPEFIRLRVREGHEDIIEHIYATLEFQGRNADRYKGMSRFMDTTEHSSDTVVVGGNLRAWRQLHLASRIPAAAVELLLPIAPAVFGQASQPLDWDWSHGDGLSDTLLTGLRPIADGPMRVTLLGWSHYKPHTTWLIEGVSRALTHQLVRHRLGSFSQESQRYVDLQKGGWTAIVPPEIQADEAALAIFERFWQQAEGAYDALRLLGIRKEDARFLLPNAAETRLVASFTDAALWHFFGQRRDSAAQWEIRRLAEHMHTLAQRRPR